VPGLCLRLMEESPFLKFLLRSPYINRLVTIELILIRWLITKVSKYCCFSSTVNPCRVLVINILFSVAKATLYTHKCLFVCSFICHKPKPLNSLKSSFFIVQSSSFIIHPSFILRLLSFSACLYLLFVPEWGFEQPLRCWHNVEGPMRWKMWGSWWTKLWHISWSFWFV